MREIRWDACSRLFLFTDVPVSATAARRKENCLGAQWLKSGKLPYPAQQGYLVPSPLYYLAEFGKIW